MAGGILGVNLTFTCFYVPLFLQHTYHFFVFAVFWSINHLIFPHSLIYFILYTTHYYTLPNMFENCIVFYDKSNRYKLKLHIPLKAITFLSKKNGEVVVLATAGFD